MRFLAIDLGARRTGLAVGDDVTRIVTPLEVIQTDRAPERLRRIAQAIARHGPDALVVGLALNAVDARSGPEGPAAARTRAFAAQLHAATGLPVHLADERLTSFAAERQMADAGLTRRRRRAVGDALAAAAILRDFLEYRHEDGPPPRRGRSP